MSETVILPLLEVNQGQHNWSTQITFQEVLQALGCHFNTKESRTPGLMEFELCTFQLKHVQPKGNRQTSDQVPNQRSKFHASPLGRIHDFQSSYRPWPSEVRRSILHKEMRNIKKPDMKNAPSLVHTEFLEDIADSGSPGNHICQIAQQSLGISSHVCSNLNFYCVSKSALR